MKRCVVEGFGKFALTFLWRLPFIFCDYFLLYLLTK